MKILCLILASDTSPEYIGFQNLWRRFMHLRREVDCYFYKGHPDLMRPAFLEDKTLWIKINEKLDTVYDKTLLAFEHFLPELHKYDFVYRSNLSTFVSFEHLIQYCNDLPKTNCCAAVTGGIPHETVDRNSLIHKHSFPGGNGFILTPDLVRRLVSDREPLDTQDDITMGNALRRWGIRITEFARLDFVEDGAWYVNNISMLNPKTERNLNPKKMMFSYRLKSDKRQRDIEKMAELIRRTYGV
jgi:hypothetical protein